MENETYDIEHKKDRGLQLLHMQPGYRPQEKTTDSFELIAEGDNTFIFVSIPESWPSYAHAYNSYGTSWEPDYTSQMFRYPSLITDLMQSQQKIERIDKRLSDLEDITKVASDKLAEIIRIVSNLSLSESSTTLTFGTQSAEAMTDENIEHISSLFDKISDVYEITEDRESITEFLARHQYLYPILEEAKEKIISVFGADVELHLELQNDPEEGVDSFFIVVKSEHGAEEAVMLENRIAEEWLLDKMQETGGNLNIISE